MKMLDYVTVGVQAFGVYGVRGVEQTFDHMGRDERLAFDLWLVKVGDQLAWHAGTTEARFKARVLAVALNRPAVNAMGLMDLSVPKGEGQ